MSFHVLGTFSYITCDSLLTYFVGSRCPFPTEQPMSQEPKPELEAKEKLSEAALAALAGEAARSLLSPG